MRSTIPRKRNKVPLSAPQSRARPTEVAPLRVSNVLLPIDFSPPSLEAIELALPLIKKFGADLHLVHVFEPDYPLASMMAMPLIVPELEVGRRVRRHLRDVAKKCSVPLRRENIHALKGRPFEEVCRLARKIDIDLIILSTRGNTGLKHLALGSTAERVVRYSPCPVLVVRRGNAKGTRRRLEFMKILVPIDFSERSARGLSYAVSLARQFKSKLVLLHSVAPPYHFVSDESMVYDFPKLMQQLEKTAREQMAGLVQETDWQGIRVETSLEIGHVGQQICARARDYGADLIVTSTHGSTGLKHILVGSTAEYVVRHAHCPVLVVPNQERPVLASTKIQI
jgi:nucleotide-binding universal stress UspA family protein